MIDAGNNLILEKLTSLPLWSVKQLGRILYVYEDDSVYFASNVGWKCLTLLTKIVKRNHINFGFGATDVNATVIPFKDESNSVIGENIHDALIFLNSRITSIDEVIQGISLDVTDYTDPLDSRISDLESNTLKIFRQRLTIDSWISAENQLFKATVTPASLSNKPYIVQCYNSIQEMVLPTKIKYDVNFNKVHIYLPEKMLLDVVIAG